MRIWLWVLGAAAAVAVITLAVVGIRAMNRSEAAANRRDAQKFLLANTICGGPPAEVKTHNARWSFGPWIEVICADGTSRVITL